MFRRKAWSRFEDWYRIRSGHALLVDGARQVGKTYLVRAFASEKFEHVAEINLYENPEAAAALSGARNSRELFLRISAFVDVPLEPGKTVIFLDEIQEAEDALTLVKFLKERADFDYILSGSLLGVKLKSIASVPMGYLTRATMYPLDFEEYCWANGVNADIVEEARAAFAEERPVDEFVDARLRELLYRYLISGGMPDAVSAFAETDSVQAARAAQNAIAGLYEYDIAKYAPPSRAHVIKRIFELIPSEAAKENKRFVVGSIEGDSHTDRYRNDLIWLEDAGVAIAVNNVTEPRYPVKAHAKENSFKLFQGDVGILTYQMGMDVVREVLGRRADINFGALYENFVAQELVAHGLDPHYYARRGVGEVDFLVQHPFDKVLPIEVKSGGSYRRHAALTKVMNTENYGIDQALVLCEGNVERAGKILYAPAYMAMFL